MRVVIFLVAALALFAQDAKPPALSVVVLGKSTAYSLDELAKMPRASVQTKSDGMPITYEGVWVHEVLKRAGAPMGDQMRGKALSSYVVATASDGYQVVFSLSELDPAMTENEALLADHADGKPLFGKDGNFRLVLPKDKRGARSIRLLTKLEVMQAAPLADKFPKALVPTDNPITAAAAELGRHLFYDARLSGNGKQSCASCHRQELAFTDGKGRAEGSTGQQHPRGAMSLVNVAYNSALTWVNPKLTSLEEQARIPMFGESPVEMATNETRFLTAARADVRYQKLFHAAYRGDGDPFTTQNVVKALATFERTIVSMNSPYDHYRYGGDASAISEAAKRGELLFFSSRAGGCFQCHSGWNLSGPVRFDGDDHREHTTTAAFRTPTLRNIALTAPYLHDGSAATLEVAIGHETAHGRPLNDVEKQDMVAFLKSLTDESVLHDPRFANPW